MTGEDVLIKRAKKGEMAAFEALVSAYERRVYTLALRSTNSHEDALDITQEVFLKAYKGLPSCRGESRFSTWLYRITMNKCVDFARSKKNVAVEPIDDEKILQLPDFKEKNQPEKSLEKTELREEIDVALNMISEEHRKVVILRGVAGMKYSDIAKALSIEEGTVKSRIARARSALRKILIDRGNISLPSSSKQSERRREDAKL